MDKNIEVPCNHARVRRRHTVRLHNVVDASRLMLAKKSGSSRGESASFVRSGELLKVPISILHDFLFFMKKAWFQWIHTGMRTQASVSQQLARPPFAGTLRQRLDEGPSPLCQSVMLGVSTPVGMKSKMAKNWIGPMRVSVCRIRMPRTCTEVRMRAIDHFLGGKTFFSRKDAHSSTTIEAENRVLSRFFEILKQYRSGRSYSIPIHLKSSLIVPYPWY